MIELKEVSKVYKLGGEDIVALDNVNLTIDGGEFVTIMGPSGSGKSTLANIIGGLDTPTKGEVIVDGQNIAHLDDSKLSHYRNKKIGFVFQSFNLQPVFTALENVMLPLIFSGINPKERIKRAKECLDAVGLADRINHKPSQLSGGQRQRVCIARAIVNNPSIIIADEPTGNLDSKKGEEIVDLMMDINTSTKCVLLIITHDDMVAKKAKRHLFIKDGNILKT